MLIKLKELPSQILLCPTGVEEITVKLQTEDFAVTYTIYFILNLELVGGRGGGILSTQYDLTPVVDGKTTTEKPLQCIRPIVTDGIMHIQSVVDPGNLWFTDPMYKVIIKSTEQINVKSFCRSFYFDLFYLYNNTF